MSGGSETFGDAKVGATTAPCPFATPPVHWLELQVIGEDKSPIPWLAYQVKLQDGSLVDGYLDGEGFARLDGLVPAGPCQVCFTELDKDNWFFVESRSASASG